MRSLTRGSGLDVLATVARLVLAAVFGYAAVTKIGDPAATVRAVRAYDLLPDPLATGLGRGLPALELTLALLLLLGIALRVTAAAAALLLVMFLVGIISADARGLEIACGCFGGGGATAHAGYALDIVRDLLLLVLAVGAALRGRSALALGPRLPAPVPDVDPSATGAERRRLRTEQQRHATAVTRHGALTRRAALAAVALLAVSGLSGVAVGAATAPAPPTAVPAGVTAAGGVVIGSASAARTLVLYEDPQCPICGQFEKTSASVVAAAVAAGQLRVEYRMRSFLGPESVRAVAALGAAQDEGRFEQLREQLFAHQPQERTGGFTVDDLVALGRAAGLTDARYVTAVKKQTYAAWARQVDDRASRDGNTGTPSLLLDGKAIDNSVAFDPAALQTALTS